MAIKKNKVKLPQLIDAFLAALLTEVESRKISDEEKSAIIRSTVAQALKDAGLKMPTIPDEVFELRDLLGKETDRGCALTAAAYLDHELGKLLKKVLIQDEPLHKELFEGYGPLASFSSRIDLAYGLGYLAPLERRDLHLIRKIRNTFAHRTGNVTFDDSEISSRCQQLHHDVFNEKLTARSKFMRVAVGIAAPIQIGLMTARTPDRAKEFNIKDPKVKGKADQVLSGIKKITARQLRQKRKSAGRF